MLDGVDLAPIEIVYNCFHQMSTNSQPMLPLPTLPPGPWEIKTQLDAFWPSALTDSWFNFKEYLKIYLSIRETAVPNYQMFICILIGLSEFVNYPDTVLTSLILLIPRTRFASDKHNFHVIGLNRSLRSNDSATASRDIWMCSLLKVTVNLEYSQKNISK